MRKRSVSILSTMIAIILTVLLSVSAFALEPEELTSATVYDRDGRVVTVGIEPGTSTWSALADGQSFTIYTGLAPNSSGMWYCNAGRVDFDYNGLVEFQDEIWYVENGKVNTDFNGEQVVGDQVYTIIRGKVVEQGYTAKAKQQIALTVAGFIGLIAFAILWRRSVKKNRRIQKEYEEQLRKEREEQERQERIRKAEETYDDEVEGQGLSYVKAQYLTPREKQFYPYLKEVADKLGYTVSMKARLGDLVTGVHQKYTSEGSKELFKVQRKHVDFVLFDPNALEVKLILELDDTTHDRQDRVNRDVFVDNVLEGTGYKILHVYGPDNLEEEILKKLNEA